MAPAVLLIERGLALTVVRALGGVVVDIRNDRVAVLEPVDGITAARHEAIEVLGNARSTAPTVLATEITHGHHRPLEETAEQLRRFGDGGDVIDHVRHPCFPCRPRYVGPTCRRDRGRTPTPPHVETFSSSSGVGFASFTNSRARAARSRAVSESWYSTSGTYRYSIVNRLGVRPRDARLESV